MVLIPSLFSEQIVPGPGAGSLAGARAGSRTGTGPGRGPCLNLGPGAVPGPGRGRVGAGVDPILRMGDRSMVLIPSLFSEQIVPGPGAGSLAGAVSEGHRATTKS